jgi:hypothetical protein
MVCNIIRFYGVELLAPCPTPKLEDHPLSAVLDCLFNIFAATLHIGGLSSIRNLRTHHAMVTGTHLSQPPVVLVVLKTFDILKHPMVVVSACLIFGVQILYGSVFLSQWLLDCFA